MIIKGEVDKVRFLGWPKGAKRPTDPSSQVHTIEVSDERSPVHHITIFTQKPLSKPELDPIDDLIPNPSYHDPDTFHLEGDKNRPISQADFHYHILMDKQPNLKSIVDTIDKIEKRTNLRVNVEIKQDIINYFTEEK